MKKIKKIVLAHKFLYKSYFLLSGKGINKKQLTKKISKLNSDLLSKKQCNDIIISLTSYGERIYDLNFALYSLIKQSLRPKLIVVWLDEVEFNYNNIPICIKKYEKFGVEFKFCPNYKSYKKLLPSIVEYPNYHIVTADDDLYYKKNWLKNIWKYHIRYPNDKIACFSDKLLFDNNKSLKKYNCWKHQIRHGFGTNFVPLGGAGVLYPKNNFHKDILNYELICKLCPLADDIWFYFMGLFNNQKTVVIRHFVKHLKYVDLYKEYGLNNKTTLQSVNVSKEYNDIQISNILDYYSISDLDLFEMLNNNKKD